MTITIDTDAGPKTVASVYSGRAGRCCCGCSGKHTYASYSADVAAARGGQAVSDRVVAQVVKKILAIGIQDDYGDCVCAVNDAGRLYIAYLADGAK